MGPQEPPLPGLCGAQAWGAASLLCRVRSVDTPERPGVGSAPGPERTSPAAALARCALRGCEGGKGGAEVQTVKVQPLKSAKGLGPFGHELRQGEVVSGVLQLAGCEWSAREGPLYYYELRKAEGIAQTSGSTFWVA